MIKEFCLAWEKNKDKLEEYFRKTRQEKIQCVQKFS